MGFASDTAQADAELAELVETEKQWRQKLEYATMNPSSTAHELRQLEEQLKRIALAREELEERCKENHEHDDDPEEDGEESVSSFGIDAKLLKAHNISLLLCICSGS